MSTMNAATLIEQTTARLMWMGAIAAFKADCATDRVSFVEPDESASVIDFSTGRVWLAVRVRRRKETRVYKVSAVTLRRDAECEADLRRSLAPRGAA